jgi:hypothetical protein
MGQSFPHRWSFFICVATSFLCTKIFSRPISYNSISFHFNHNDYQCVSRLSDMLASFLSLSQLNLKIMTYGMAVSTILVDVFLALSSYQL